MHGVDRSPLYRDISIDIMASPSNNLPVDIPISLSRRLVLHSATSEPRFRPLEYAMSLSTNSASEVQSLLMLTFLFLIL